MRNDTPHDDTQVPDDDEAFSPTGTLLFVMIMLVGYALYWAYLWFLVMIERT